MFTRRHIVFLTLFTVVFLMSGTGSAFTLLTKEEALEEVFFKDVVIETETKILEGGTLDRIKGRLGGSLVYSQEDSESEKVASEGVITFYFAKKDGERIGVAIIDIQPGKWGPVEFIIALDLAGKVQAVRVMSYEEIRGRPIARLSYMNQYRGKTIDSTLVVGKDIVGISGATVSSRSATFAVKKALVLYEELYQK